MDPITIVASAVGLLMAMLTGGTVDTFKRLSSRYRDEEKELTASISELGSGPERMALEQRQEEVKISAAFEDEGRSASVLSWFTFVFGILVSLAVVGFGIWEWASADQAESLSTGTGLARVGVIAAAFYVAGQLFRRSTTLQIRGQEFSRAAMAMDITDDLAGHITDPDARDSFLVAVYQHHLTGSTPGSSGTDAGGGPDIVKLADAAAKLKDV